MLIETTNVNLATTSSVVPPAAELGNWSIEASGIWTELIASTSELWGGFEVRIAQDNAGTWRNTGIVRLALGAPGSEVQFLLLPRQSISRAGSINVFVPLSIPAGSRISAAYNADRSGLTGVRQIQVTGFPASAIGETPFTNFDVGPFRDGGVETYGKGVLIPAPAVANTKGAWTEVSQSAPYTNLISGDSLPHTYSHLGVIFTAELTNLSSEMEVLLDIATGAPGSEVVVAENIQFKSTTFNGHFPQIPSVIWFAKGAIAAGTRISARIQTDIIDKPIGLLLAGVR